jgi:hypothetical protein
MSEAKRPGEARCVVEVIGVAGSGKSTVFGALVAERERIAGRPHLRAIASLPRIGLACAAVLLTLVVRRALVARAAMEQVRMMAHLRLLPPYFRRGDASGGMHVFDQGPIFYLTRNMLMHPRLGAWRAAALVEWGSVLDVVVWLDAPDVVLAERINARPTGHRLKGTAEDAAVQELARARAVIRELVETLEAEPNGPQVFRYDTTRNSIEVVVDAVLQMCSARSNEPPASAERH